MTPPDVTVSGKRLFTEPGRTQGTTREGVPPNINITAESKGLTGPALDETNHAYRLAHIDRAWRNRIDNNLFNLEPEAWMKLPHEEFFQELIRTFPRSYNKGHQLAWTKLTYVQEAERFIDTSVMADLSTPPSWQTVIRFGLVTGSVTAAPYSNLPTLTLS